MAKRDRQRKVVPATDKMPKKVVSNPIPLVEKSTREKVWFDFQFNNWLTSVKVKNFTNFLKNQEEFIKNQFEIFYTIIPKVISEWNDIIRSRGNYPYLHCHLLKEDKKTKVREVFKEIYKYPLDEDLNIWQFGFTGSVRLICIHNDIEKALIPIFIDHHHLIYDNEKYNKLDYKNYSYCAVCQFVKKKNVVHQ